MGRLTAPNTMVMKCMHSLLVFSVSLPVGCCARAGALKRQITRAGEEEKTYNMQINNLCKEFSVAAKWDASIAVSRGSAFDE